jgi:hypothetical protein
MFIPKGFPHVLQGSYSVRRPGLRGCGELRSPPWQRSAQQGGLKAARRLLSGLAPS